MYVAVFLLCASSSALDCGIGATRDRLFILEEHCLRHVEETVSSIPISSLGVCIHLGEGA